MTEICTFCKHEHTRPRRYKAYKNTPTFECRCGCPIAALDYAVVRQTVERERLVEAL